LQTSNHVATLNPTSVANVQGSGSYASTAASSFIGSGSAGDVTQVAAGLDIDFAGSINNGMVDLNSIGGTLSDPGCLISSSIEANLGGVFTGIAGEAFVGRFYLIDEMNLLNQINGLYTIER
jgi:hypothetical protein